MLYSERANPAKVHHLTNVQTDPHGVSNCERRCRPTGDVNDYFQVRQGLCHKEAFSILRIFGFYRILKDCYFKRATLRLQL